MREEANLGQLFDLKPQYEETVEMLKQAVDRQQKVVDTFEFNNDLSLDENEAKLAFEKQQLRLSKSMYYEKKYNDLEWITKGHDPLDHIGIHNLRVGENDFADRFGKEDRRVKAKSKRNLGNNW